MCSEVYDADTEIALSAEPDNNSNFSGWSDGCTDGGKVDMDAAKNCTATFTGKGTETVGQIYLPLITR